MVARFGCGIFLDGENDSCRLTVGARHRFCHHGDPLNAFLDEVEGGAEPGHSGSDDDDGFWDGFWDRLRFVGWHGESFYSHPCSRSPVIDDCGV